jgi:hypothetical protein
MRQAQNSAGGDRDHLASLCASAAEPIISGDNTAAKIPDRIPAGVI